MHHEENDRALFEGSRKRLLNHGRSVQTSDRRYRDRLIDRTRGCEGNNNRQVAGGPKGDLAIIEENGIYVSSYRKIALDSNHERRTIRPASTGRQLEEH
jgi:hypothetical protein